MAPAPTPRLLSAEAAGHHPHWGPSRDRYRLRHEYMSCPVFAAQLSSVKHLSDAPLGSRCGLGGGAGSDLLPDRAAPDRAAAPAAAGRDGPGTRLRRGQPGRAPSRASRPTVRCAAAELDQLADAQGRICQHDVQAAAHTLSDRATPRGPAGSRVPQAHRCQRATLNPGGPARRPPRRAPRAVLS
jgi:hypothetical protein